MDRRVRRTRLLLGNALIDLMQKRKLSEITIRDITEQADVAYSTFFRNFESIEHLLLVHLRGFVQVLQERVVFEEDAPYPVQARGTIRTLFEVIEEDPKLHQVLFRTPAAQPVVEAFKAEQMDANLALLRQMGIKQGETQPPMELVIHNTITQMIGMIVWWLKSNSQPSPAEMADYYETLVLRPMWTHLIGVEATDALFDGTAPSENDTPPQK